MEKNRPDVWDFETSIAMQMQNLHLKSKQKLKNWGLLFPEVAFWWGIEYVSVRS